MSIYNNNSKYGITERKKEELDRLADQVLVAQHKVEELQAVVASLTSKSADFSAALALATAKKATALSNDTMISNIVQSALATYNDAYTAYGKLKNAEHKSKHLAKNVNKLIKELIYFTLVALKSVFAGETSCLESEGDANLVVCNAGNLYEVLSGKLLESLQPLPEELSQVPALQKLIHDEYINAQERYDRALKANDVITGMLNDAIADLTVAQTNLSSLQAGLAAANAAAFAS
ncbi:MAG: hypothetical protein NTW29_16895 [Bacteroidetes bacterium]|nr:hypothetical protein [Bacteroidota bacterium]